MATSRSTIPRWQAIREAGRAVACWDTGTRFERVWVGAAGEATAAADGGGSDGLTMPSDSAPEEAPARRLRLETELFIHGAGLTAEARVRGCEVAAIAAIAPGRWAVALRCAEALEGDAKRGQALLNQIFARVRTLLNAPKVWAAVNAVAGALQARRSLGGDEAVTIIERVTGRGPGRIHAGQPGQPSARR